MNKEVETKFKIESEYTIRGKLKKIKAIPLSKELQRDIYYRGPGFLRNCTAIRLRKSNKKNIFTIKIKKQKRDSQTYKIRNELETGIENPEIFDKTLKALGLKPFFRKDKIRSVYRWKKALICFDRLPYIGSYVEIEASKKDIQYLASLLGFRIKEATSDTYLTIFNRYKARHKRPNVEMIFKKRKRH